VHLNQSLSNKGGQQIATITFKYNTAQRRFMDRVLWDRLRQDSPIYNGDTVRIADKSGATVHFSDGNSVELGENTLAQFIMREDSGSAVDVNSGSLRVQSSGRGISVSSAGRTVEVKGSSAVNIVSGKKLSVSVEKGSASVKNSGGQSQKVDAGSAVSVSGAGSIEKPVFSVISPARGSSMLNFSQEPLRVQYACSYTGKGPVSGLLELSPTADFKSAERHEFTDPGALAVSAGPGIWYWRISLRPKEGAETAAQDLSAAGKFTVLYAPGPMPEAPEPGTAASYRTRNPDIRFIWTGNDYVSSYLFEVADNSGMANPLISQRTDSLSSIVSSLGAGTWYWRVTPYYALNGIGFSRPSPVSSFKIEKRATLDPPELVMPAPEEMVNTLKKGADGKQGLVFSWKSSPEAASYRLTVGRENSPDSAFTAQTNSNYYILDSAQHPLENEAWYKWQVSIVDPEGNSAVSKSRRFYSSSSEPFQRSIFPPAGYRLSQNLTSDMEYVWKSNVDGEARFQISRAGDFSNCLVDVPAARSPYSGSSLEPGTYYWRVKSVLGSLELATEPKELIVEAPLAAPGCVSPPDSGRAVVGNKKNFHFAWRKVDGADYYKFRLFTAADSNETAYERDLIGDTGIDLDLAGFKEQRYRWTVQAFRSESPMASRSSGSVGSYAFELRQLKPISLLSPAKGATISGIDAAKNPPLVKWLSAEPAASSRFVLYRSSGSRRTVVANIRNPQKSFRLPRLTPGTYYWTVSGTTADGLDISAVETRRFRVSALPALPAPQDAQPADSFVVNDDYLARQRKIVFSWDEVPDATRYIFRLSLGGKVIIEKTLDKGARSYVLDDLSVLKPGNFTWTVEAQSIYQGRVFQKGKVLVRKFSVVLPKLQKPQSDDPGDLYGG